MRFAMLVRRLVELWVRVYTLGLPSMPRQARIDLIRSDLHDHLADRRANNGNEVSAWALLSRCLRGIPDDVSWRLFDAERSRPVQSLAPERRLVMPSRPLPAAFFAINAGIAWAATLVLVLQPLPHSLAYAGALLAIVALVAWTIEARNAGDEATAGSVWPLALAAAIVVIAAGLVFDGARAGLALTLPLSLALTITLGSRLTAARRQAPETLAAIVSPSQLAQRAAAGDALAIERISSPGVTRRALLRGSFGIGLASAFAAMGGVMTDFLWRRNVSGFGGVVTAGLASSFPPGSKTRVREGKFWLVNLTPEQGGPGFIALWQKCPHLGCVVPWEPRFGFKDPRTGDRTEGWFRCPCHQSTYDHAGVRVFGPATRSMDRMAVRITEEGYVEVDTSDIAKGTDDNAEHVVLHQPGAVAPEPNRVPDQH